MLTHRIQKMVWIRWSTGWSVSEYYAPGWFTGPAIAEDLLCEIDSMQNPQSNLSDATTELDDVVIQHHPSPELLWSGDSDSEIKIWARVKFEDFIHRNVWPILGGRGVQRFTYWGHQAGPMQRIICIAWAILCSCVMYLFIHNWIDRDSTSNVWSRSNFGVGAWGVWRSLSSRKKCLAWAISCSV